MKAKESNLRESGVGDVVTNSYHVDCINNTGISKHLCTVRLAVFCGRTCLRYNFSVLLRNISHPGYRLDQFAGAAVKNF